MYVEVSTNGKVYMFEMVSELVWRERIRCMFTVCLNMYVHVYVQ